jgi:soluble lytic murein transglycosylase
MADPPDQKPADPPHYAVLVTEILDDQDSGGPQTTPLEEKKKPAGSRSPLITLLASGAVVLLLLVGTLWWVLTMDDGLADTTPWSPLPNGDAVALINSSTPIPVRFPPMGADSVEGLDSSPDEQTWSPQLREAHKALDEGRYTAATSLFSALVGDGKSEAAQDALWGLAETYETSGQRELALRAYSLYSGLADERAIRGLYRVAMLSEDSGRDSLAAQHYGAYAKLEGPARHAAMLSQARLLGPTNEAEAVYTAVLEDSPLDVDGREALMGLAELHSRRGNHSAARGTYDKLAEIQRDRPRPVLDHEGRMPAQVLAAEEARAAGDIAGARTRLLEYIGAGCTQESAPCAYYPFGRHSAINTLLKVEANAVLSGTISPMLAAQTAYDAGFYGRAVVYLDMLRAQSEDPALRAQAALLTGKAHEASAEVDLAYNWYTATVQVYPQSPLAPEAIRLAGDMLVRLEQWDAAYAVYQDAIWRYPDVRVSGPAYLNAAVLAHRLGKEEDALTLLRPLMSPPPIYRAAAAFWTAKVIKAQGRPEVDWKETLRPAVNAAPGTYLDFRAGSVMLGEPESGPLVPTFVQSKVAPETLGVHYSEEPAQREELLNWASTLPSTTVTITTALTPTALQPLALGTLSSEVERALLLVELGDDRAFTAMRALAERLAQEEAWRELARLVLYARYHADTRTALRVAERMTLHVGGDPFGYPRLLLKTLYPTPYSDLVTTEARVRDIDPLVMYALMRQESQFVPNARSHADARGLTQVIPSTGLGIAQQLGETNYDVEDLYLPHVSVRFGTYYLASNMPNYERKLLPTLAAYNGGPGNAARWLDGSALRDPDLYLERVDIRETEDYLRIVYTNYGFYRLIYAP